MTPRHTAVCHGARRALRGTRVAGTGWLVLALGATALPAQAGTPGAALDASRRTAIVAAVERLAPAVVSISVAARQQVAVRSSWADMFVPRYASQLIRG